MNKNQILEFINSLKISYLGKRLLEEYAVLAEYSGFNADHISMEILLLAGIRLEGIDIRRESNGRNLSAAEENKLRIEEAVFKKLVNADSWRKMECFKEWENALLSDPASVFTDESRQNGIRLMKFLRQTNVTGISLIECTLGKYGFSPVRMLQPGVAAFERRHPAKVLSDATQQRRLLETELPKYVVGQQQAIDSFIDGFFSGDLKQQKVNGRPKGLRSFFLFAGAPGTGKSFFAETVASILGLPVKKFNMTSYSAKEDGKFGLFGCEPLWKGSRTGELSDFVWKNPISIVIFDEIEKASPDVLRNMLQIFSDGEYTDSFNDMPVYMQHVILIMTSNAGKNLYQNAGYDPSKKYTQSVLLNALKNDKNENGMSFFPPELCSRFASGTISFFNELNSNDYFTMASSAMAKSAVKLRNSGIVDIHYNYMVYSTLLFSAGGQLDGRNVTAKSDAFFSSILSDAAYDMEKWNLAHDKDGDKRADTLCRLDVSIDLSSASDDVRALYPDHWDIPLLVKSLDMLISHHQAVTYSVRHTIDIAGLNVLLYDLKLEKAVDAEDQDSIMPAEGVPDIHWDDVIISQDAKNELQRYVDYLSDPYSPKYKEMLTPKGILLYGPPGTGKTTIAKIVAAEAGVSFFHINAGELLNSGNENITSLFAKCRKYAPSIFFIDEIDAIGISRTMGNSVRTELNSLLEELDGFNSRNKKPVFVIAATNLPGQLDDALLRRFDRQILIGKHNRTQRREFIRKYISGKQSFDLSEDDIDFLCIRTAGISPAQIEGGLQTALREALWTDRRVDVKLASDGLDRYLYGESRPPKGSSEQIRALLRRYALHEAGHIVSYYGFAHLVPVYATIVGRGGYGGYMQPDIDSENEITRKAILAQTVRTALGGRAAELVFYGDEDGLSTGAAGDIETATKRIVSMIFSEGLYPGFGLAAGSCGDDYNYSFILGQPQLLEKVNSVLAEELETTVSYIREHRDKVELIANELIDKEELIQEELKELLNR